MLETHNTKDNEIIRTMTPVEYVKAHQAEENHRRHVIDLHQFVAFMSGELKGVDLSMMTPEGADRLIESYLSKSHG